MTARFGDPNREFGIPGVDDQEAGSPAQQAGIRANQSGGDDRASAAAAAAAGGWATDWSNPDSIYEAWRRGGGMDYNWLAFNGVPGYQSTNDQINAWMYGGAKKPTFGADYWKPGPNTINAAQYTNIPGMKAPSVATVAPAQQGAPSVAAMSASPYVAPGANPSGGPGWNDPSGVGNMTVGELFEAQYPASQGYNAYQIWQQQSAANAQSAPSAQPAQQTPAPAGTASSTAPAGTAQPTQKQWLPDGKGGVVDVTGMTPEQLQQFKDESNARSARQKELDDRAYQLQLDTLAAKKAADEADKAYKEAMVATNNQQIAQKAAYDAMYASLQQQGIDLQKKQLALQYRRQAVGAPRITTRA